MSPESLPIDEVLPLLRATLGANRNVVLSAPPGAGKTTRVPPALLAGEWMAGRRIVMLEPRRLAARRAAAFMAARLGEKPGGTVGYRTRGDTAVGKDTRIEVVTEGVLTRMLQSAPDLPGVALLIFDEFHERSIHADLGLALALDAQTHLRPELRIVVMSATIDTGAVAESVGGAPVITSEGRAHPVETRRLEAPGPGPVEPAVAAAVRRALRETQGDVLVFLPGQREIRRTAELLGKPDPPADTEIHMLYGDAAPGVQSAALAPAPAGRRKVILSTSLAETSLTIDGVRTVIDSGLARVPRFDPRRGMTGLVTVPVSRATADQRRGRAGRQAPGVCYRLWSAADEAALPASPTPEILAADLAPLALELAVWGSPDGAGLRFMDPPPAAHLERARETLRLLGAITRDGAVTPLGRAMAALPVHPRLARMILASAGTPRSRLACEVAALLEERGLLPRAAEAGVELASRLHALHQGGPGVDRGARERTLAEARRLHALAHAGAGGRTAPAGEDDPGVLLALAYPDRIAQRRGTAAGRRYLLSGGAGAILPERSTLSRERYLAVGEVDGAGTEVRILQAAPITEESVRAHFGALLEKREVVRWEEEAGAVRAVEREMLGALPLVERPLPAGDPRVRAVVVAALRAAGVRTLPFSDAARDFRTRSLWLAHTGMAGDEWPDLRDEHLESTLEEWLGPFLRDVTRREQLAHVDLPGALRSLFTHGQLRLLDSMAPTHLTTPAGSRVRLEYSPDGPPVLAVRLQEMFGQSTTPTVAGGRVAVRLHLLSPAGRPLAVTQNLVTFWKEAYPEVRKEMRGRYPKHVWPEDPTAARPTRRAGAAGKREAGGG